MAIYLHLISFHPRLIFSTNLAEPRIRATKQMSKNPLMPNFVLKRRFFGFISTYDTFCAPEGTVGNKGLSNSFLHCQEASLSYLGTRLSYFGTRLSYLGTRLSYLGTRLSSRERELHSVKSSICIRLVIKLGIFFNNPSRQAPPEPQSTCQKH